MKKKDHFEMLEELSAKMEKSSEIVKTIGRCMELDEVAEVRAELPKHLVEASILIEVLQVKLSIMASEWNDNMKEVVEILKKENKEEENFDSMDF